MALSFLQNLMSNAGAGQQYYQTQQQERATQDQMQELRADEHQLRLQQIVAGKQANQQQQQEIQDAQSAQQKMQQMNDQTPQAMMQGLSQIIASVPLTDTKTRKELTDQYNMYKAQDDNNKEQKQITFDNALAGSVAGDQSSIADLAKTMGKSVPITPEGVNALNTEATIRKEGIAKYTELKQAKEKADEDRVLKAQTEKYNREEKLARDRAAAALQQGMLEFRKDMLNLRRDALYGTDDDNDAYAAAGEAGFSGYGTKAAVREIKAAAKAHPEFTMSEVAHNIKEEQGLNLALNAQQKQLGIINGFEKTVAGNIKLLQDEIKTRQKGNNIDIPLSNQARLALHDFEGIPDAERASIYGKELAGELTKLTTTANATGVGGTEAGREKWEKFFSQYKSVDQLSVSLDAATKSAITRIQGAKDAIAETKKAQRDLWIKGNTSAPSSGAASSESGGLPAGWT